VAKEEIRFQQGEIIMKNLVLIAITLWSLAFAGCAAGSAGDDTITANVKSRLAANSSTSAAQIGVETKNGFVTLTGIVPTATEKETAERVAKNTEGVKSVTNIIVVNPDSAGAMGAEKKAGDALEKAGEAIGDVAILTKIKTQFVADGITGTDVDVSNGEVTLKGEVENAQEKSKAVTIVKKTEGVKGVKNMLTFKKK
jgi:osmotically-inducible protein OsmY